MKKTFICFIKTSVLVALMAFIPTFSYAVAIPTTGLPVIGPINDCTPFDQPSITVTSPNGGETYVAGQQITVTWKSCNIPSTASITINTDYDGAVLDGGETQIIVPNTGSTLYSLPSAQILQNYYGNVREGGNHFQIELHYINSSPSLNDQSDATFTIQVPASACTINSFVGSPNVIIPGATSTLQWDTTGCQSVVIDGVAHPASGTLTTDPLAVTKLYLLTARTSDTGCGTANCPFKRTAVVVNTDICPNIDGIQTTIPAGMIVNGQALCVLSTPAPTSTIVVVSPNGGETYTAGQEVAVAWRTTDFTPYALVHVDLVRQDSNGNNSNTGAFPLTPTLNDGTHTFTIPSTVTPGNNYKIRVDVQEQGTVLQTPPPSDFSDSTFSIQPSLGGKPLPTTIDAGCSGSRYSFTTGKLCEYSVVPMTTVDAGCTGTRYSSTTGKLCTNFIVNTSSPATPLTQNEAGSVAFTRTLKIGVRGDDVKQLQQILGISADGVFGSATASKVKLWQLSKGLKPDGLFGAASRLKINAK